MLEDEPIFAGLPEGMLEVIAGCAVNVHFAADETIFREGDSADTFYVIRRGRVAVEIADPGRGSLVIDTLGPGEVLGVSWLLPPYVSTFDGRAVESTSAVAVDGNCLRNKCDADQRLGYELFQRFAGLIRDRLQSARLRLIDLHDGRER